MFDDDSVGWYEAGWGPMMSEVAYFVKDIVGPKGSASIAYKPEEGRRDQAGKLSDSADIEQHTRANAIRVHHAEIDADNNFVRPDEWIPTEDEPSHQQLCDREQALFLRRSSRTRPEPIMADAVSSLRIVLAAQQSIDTGRAVEL